MKIHIVTGFMDAGKTTYICSLLKNDYSYKRADGSALLLLCEDGDEEYDEELLSVHRVTVIETTADAQKIADLLQSYETAEPDQIPAQVFIEWNAMSECALGELCDTIHPTTVTTVIDGTTLEVYFNNMKQLFLQMIQPSTLVVFNRIDREILADYAHAFRLMNDGCGYLWEGPGGHHEKAFDDVLPYDKSVFHYHITDAEYSFFWLDVQKHPRDYFGKRLSAMIEVSRRGEDGETFFSAGRRVMTCCMADLSFMSFPCCYEDGMLPRNQSFLSIEAEICDSHIYQGIADILYSPVVLRITKIQLSAPPQNLIIT